uniref:Clathrin_bdg domain-containing protein n=1 Tax=Haemonchus placei TaxID=6290 RepID=A0A0N4W087_HAEPC
LCLTEDLAAVPLNEHDNGALNDLADDVFDDNMNVPADESDGAVAIPQANLHDGPVFGASLHDELILADVQPGSNSLLSRGWKTPKTTSSEPDRSGSALLSSSSGTEADGGIVSFDQALRSAMEVSGSPDKVHFR